MNATLNLERRLATWLEQDGPADVPANAVEAALAQARTIRQREAWLTRSWWDRRPLAAAPARVEAGAIEPAERITTFPVARPPLRPAWALLLLAGLLLAMAGGALLVGSQLERKLPAVVPPVGELFECPPGSTPDTPGPADQARPSLVAMEIVLDRRAGRLVAVTSAGQGVETWTFDVCANTWTQMHPDREPPGVGIGELVYDVDSDVTILVSIDDDPSIARVNVWAYDLRADAWTEKGAPPQFVNPVSLAYDPVSGLVVAAGVLIQDTLIWTYDVESDAWTPIQQANAGPSDGAVYVFGSVIAYDASVDRIVAYTKRYDGYGHVAETWLFDVRTGTWSRSSAQTPHVVQGLGLPDIEYEEAARRTVIMGTVAAAYDAAVDRWAMLDAGQSMVYDPVNERLVGPGPDYGVDDAAGVPVGRADVFAFDPGTGAWTVLLEARGEVRPSNAPATMPAPTSARTPTPSGGAGRTDRTSPARTASPASTP